MKSILKYVSQIFVFYQFTELKQRPRLS